MVSTELKLVEEEMPVGVQGTPESVLGRTDDCSGAEERFVEQAATNRFERFCLDPNSEADLWDTWWRRRAAEAYQMWVDATSESEVDHVLLNCPTLESGVTCPLTRQCAMDPSATVAVCPLILEIKNRRSSCPPAARS
jgi:hypothetical protein